MMIDEKYQMCTNCVMDTSDPNIQFDADGVCNHCRRSAVLMRGRSSLQQREQQLQQTIKQIKSDGKSRDYDCVLGLSGGVDSSFLAHEAVSRGLRPLAVHVDAGWNSELAVKNVESLVKKLDIDLFTYVVDWEEMRDLQVAFLRSGVANQDIPQDHAIVAAVLKVTSDHGIRWLLSGANTATESILPNAWGYNARDPRHLRAIWRRFGNRRPKKYPTISFFRQYVYYPYIRGIRKVKLLNYIDYNKQRAMDVLQSEYGWRYYGGKHYESRFTKFFQGYFLPVKFGYDKRRAHLSSLVVSGQMTRDAALDALKGDMYPRSELAEDKAFVLKKLGISEQEFNELLHGPQKTYLDYPSSAQLFRFKSKIKSLLAG
jgi:N-acetyl sugar amidotransferase